jgi:trans-aconitate methyltransferase
VPALGDVILQSLAPRRGERILDVGCGDGALTARIAAAGARVVGVDASRELVQVAQARDLDVRLGDAAELEFDSEFDAVFSNAALHWVLDHRGAASGMFAALRPGGRLVVEFGGFGNIAAIRTALLAALRSRGVVVGASGTNDSEMTGQVMPADQFYPTAECYAQVLTEAGFTEVHAELVPRPTPLAAGMVAWLSTFRGGLMDVLEVHGAARQEVFDEVADLLRPALCADDGMWWADYVRIRAWAIRPVHQQ